MTIASIKWNSLDETHPGKSGAFAVMLDDGDETTGFYDNRNGGWSIQLADPDAVPVMWGDANELLAHLKGTDPQEYELQRKTLSAITTECAKA